MQRSFIPSANDPDGPFPLNNLPYAVCSPSENEPPTVCVAIGDHMFNLSAAALEAPQVFAGPLLSASQASAVFSTSSLNAFLQLGRSVWQEVRHHLTSALAETPAVPAWKALVAHASFNKMFPKRCDVHFTLPFTISDYTDFYSSLSHATNVGTMFRGKDNALPPNWKHMPIAYHGRASSVVLSGTSIRRPCAQLMRPAADAPMDAPSALLDFELEMGVVIGGRDNPLGTRVDPREATERVFGFCLLNDWSARDVQKWEYVPLGPFTAKNFATTISPFVIPMDALLPFARPLPEQIPAPLPYLQAGTDAVLHCAFDVQLQVAIATHKGEAPSVVCESNLKNLYWSVAQQIAHHTVTGCNLRAGDLFGSGTISGDDGMSLLFFSCLFIFTL